MLVDPEAWNQIVDGNYDCALIFDEFEIPKFPSFPVFLFDHTFRDFLIEVANTSGISISLSREYRGGNESLADFSSLGPSNTGVIKPDVVAPGQHIFSARSTASGTPNHDLDPLDLQLMDGTSMATPNVAGSAALIEQYFRSGFYRQVVQPTATFLKGMLIHCADPLPPDRKFPNHQFGFGQLNLGGYLPFEDSLFSILVNESVLIGPSQHLVGNVSISSDESPLRITISYLDPPASADSLIPLLADLDLIVISTTGKVFRGNHYLNGLEEHFSTTERVILNSDEVEVGDYEIHVISSFLDSVQNATFSVIVSGGISTEVSDLEFTNAAACIPCGEGTCDSETFICKCQSPTIFGQSCQIEAKVIPLSENPVTESVTVQPLESLYVRLTTPQDSNNFVVRVSGDSPIVLRIFVAVDSSPNGIPFKYETVIWDNNSVRSDWQTDISGSVVDLLIRNEFSVPWRFRVGGNTVIPIPERTAVVSPTSTDDEGLTGGAIVVVVAGAVVARYLLRRRRDSTSTQLLRDDKEGNTPAEFSKL
jgi:hypothetical protein